MAFQTVSKLLCSKLGLFSLISSILISSGATLLAIYEGHTQDSQCKVEIVESIPEGLVYNKSEVIHKPTYEAWLELFNLTQKSLHLASSYWTLRGSDVYKDPSDWQGESVFSLLKKAAIDHGIKIKIAQNMPASDQPNLDTEDLAKIDGIEVKSLNFKDLMGGGILHTKLWISDDRHFYVGSANFDWRSLTQVKEIGVLATHCPTLASDMAKIFEVYWTLGGSGKKVPPSWPETLNTRINSKQPLALDSNTGVFLSSSPPPFCPIGRESDITAILEVIREAKDFIHIAVMDYSPSFLYTKDKKYWPVVDDEIRKAIVERGVEVKLLFSLWNHTKPDMINYMKSIAALDGLKTLGPGRSVQARLFKVPAFTPAQEKVPFARVNHNKYIVTEKSGIIGTSNWSADYFVNTGGIGFAIKSSAPGQSQIHEQLKKVFLRDWNSAYAQALDKP